LLNKKALICGVSGQDGALLAKLLLEKGYHVVGTSRDAQASSFRNLKALNIYDDIERKSMATNDFRSVLQTLNNSGADEVYNLSGQSSVGLSFEQPVETLESHATGTLNLLEAIRYLGGHAHFYNAASSECFGDTGGEACDEMTAFRPCSPYAVAKSAAFWEAANYRSAYDMFVCSGILFNHESPLRPERFVTRKIVCGACRIALGSKERLQLGNIDISRDWGWAEEYVEAMWAMMQHDVPDDYVIATGESMQLQMFIEYVFKHLSLAWREYVDINPSFLRPSEIMLVNANPNKAADILDWTAETKGERVAQKMVDAEMERIQQ